MLIRRHILVNARPIVAHKIALLLVLLVLLFGGCKSAKEPIILTFWHNYGGVLQAPMDGLVEEFNATLGKEQSIRVNIVSVAETAAIRDKLTQIAGEEPGAPEMPDLTTCYPQTAVILQNEGLIANLAQYFTKEEVDAYLPQFLDEGRLAGGLYVFPFAKSTEVLFLNQTLFDRFATASGVEADFSTFEGIAAVAQQYYNWTEQTGGVGKAFYAADSLFNIAQIGMQQLGENLLLDNVLQLDGPTYERIWSSIALPALAGGYAMQQQYSSELAKTGDILCAIGSSAGFLFYGTEVTYTDGATTEVEYTILPYPVFTGGEKVALQRGGGIVVASSTPEKEKAAVTFLKWLTAPQQNIKFSLATGYLPVTHAAFETELANALAKADNENVQKLLQVAITLHKDYDFYTPPVFEGYDAISKSYEGNAKDCLTAAKNAYATGPPDALLENAINEALSYLRIQLFPPAP